MKQKIRPALFVLSAFLLGSINGLYGIGFYIFLMMALLVNVCVDFKGFLAAFREEWKYLILPLVGVMYLVLHYIFSLVFVGRIDVRPSWSTVELLVLYFFFIPLYWASARSFVTPLLLRRFLFALCWGILAFNFVKLFYITGVSLFKDTGNTLNLLYTGRFGGNMELLGGFVYLEPQAIYICASALISYFFLLKQFWVRDNKRVVWQSVVILVFSFIFLSFTVTKGTILATGTGMLVLSLIFFKKMTGRCRLLFCLGGVALVFLIYFFTPEAYVQRIKEMRNEITHVRKGDFQGGSIGPRAGLMKENFSHFREFGIWGLGVYKKYTTREWYAHSPYIPVDVTNAHNSFVEFWLRGGILGLLFIIYYFLAPVLKMMRLKKYSFLALAMIIAFFIANNTCVLIILVDSSPLVAGMLAMFYLYTDKFIVLQEETNRLQHV